MTEYHIIAYKREPLYQPLRRVIPNPYSNLYERTELPMSILFKHHFEFNTPRAIIIDTASLDTLVKRRSRKRPRQCRPYVNFIKLFKQKKKAARK